MNFRTAAIGDDNSWDSEDEDPGQRRRPQTDDFNTIEWTPELRSELLEPTGWGTILELYARTMKLAVALIDGDGELVGICHNPQPIWSLTRKPKATGAGDCLFCLETRPNCTAAADALRTESLTLVHDRAGFAHVAIPLSLGGMHLGTLLAGQILDRYPEPLPLQRAAKEFGVSAQALWHLALQQTPMSRDNLTVYGELLRALARTFLRDRYGSVLENRWNEKTKALNQQLATVNSTLKRKVAELDRSHSDLENLLESTDIATIFLDRDLRIKKFTPVAGGLIQLADGDIGRHLADLGPRFADAADSVGQIAELVGTLSIGSRQEHPLVQERYLTGARGEHYLMRVLPYRTAEHIIDGAVVTFVDVTLLKNAEQEAETARIYAENIVATVRHPLLVLDDKLRVKSGNDAFYSTFRVLANETEGQLIYELGNGQWDLPGLRLLLGELLVQNQSVQNFEIEHDFAHIGLRTMLLNACRIDHVDLFLLAIEDITERKVAETLLHNLNLNLKNFAHSASHDLQEPLRTVKLSTQLLARQYKGKLDPQADEFMASAIEGADRVEALLLDLRQYWFVNEPLRNRVPVECARVLEKTLQSLQVPLKESGATVTHAQLPTVPADEVGLAMLFQNLVGNAIKYRRAGEPPDIRIAVEKKANMWCFSVEDNGIGIQTKFLEQIFAPFKRLHGHDVPGTGLGLALCKKIVERYGGELWVESCYGQGSTFFFTIPGE